MALIFIPYLSEAFFSDSLINIPQPLCELVNLDGLFQTLL